MLRKLTVTFFGLGLLPMMPGTFASLAAAVLYFVLYSAHVPLRFVLLPLCLLCAVLCVRLTPWAEKEFGRTDPRQCVLDEVVGQWMTLMIAPMGPHPLQQIIIGFFLFRAFDVAKPFPVRDFEKLPRGWGVLLDDVAAGIYSGVILWILVRFIQPMLS